jgi:hypothetical protein
VSRRGAGYGRRKARNRVNLPPQTVPARYKCLTNQIIPRSMRHAVAASTDARCRRFDSFAFRKSLADSEASAKRASRD